MTITDIIPQLRWLETRQLQVSLVAEIIRLISGFIIITCKFNTVTLNKRTNLTCPKGSSWINMSCIGAQQSFYLKTKTFSDGCFKSTWQGLRLPIFFTKTNLRLKFFSVSARLSEN